MPRPRCVRRIISEIRACSVVPFEGDAALAQKLFGGAELVTLEPDEVESLRLADLEHRYQEEAARLMGVSRPTFGRILERVRTKVADALINGKALNIERAKAPCLERAPFAEERGIPSQGASPAPREPAGNAAPTISESGETTMKIAFVSDDGTTISHHFGRAQRYVVLTIEGGKILQREERPKAAHHHAGGQHEAHHGHGDAHGFEPGAQTRHASMLDPVRDCAAVIAGGMGAGAYSSIQSAGLEAIVAAEASIDEAAAAYIAGTLKNHLEYLH